MENFGEERGEDEEERGPMKRGEGRMKRRKKIRREKRGGWRGEKTIERREK